VSTTFDVQRLWLLIRGDFIAGWRTLATGCAAAFAILALNSILSAWRGGGGDQLYVSWCMGALFVTR